jgi:hypothetical protein
MEMMAQDTVIITAKVATSALARQRRKQVNKVIEPALLRELSLVIGGEYASYKLSEEAWNYWLEIVKLIQEGEGK